ncbi:hypothetical protein [Roseateles oligotrophus]|uniref:Uncharacterized protein n=1 Tax=Roseateles oligotrophus TaxID=1769250 RepID=A0ABT2YI26_9BURK|nr:hypothetical protein [Roseateles oligotrophus]MCV2369722.1 hypothetical protein [Roseateles oligotrophus]
MNTIALGIILLAASILYAAYAEFKAENQRDFRLLAGLGGAGTLAGASLYLL